MNLMELQASLRVQCAQFVRADGGAGTPRCVRGSVSKRLRRKELRDFRTGLWDLLWNCSSGMQGDMAQLPRKPGAAAGIHMGMNARGYLASEPYYMVARRHGVVNKIIEMSSDYSNETCGFE
jgi:hypothetical protein